MIVNHWTHDQKNIVFDPNTGIGKIVLLDSPQNESEKPKGFGATEKRLFGKSVQFVIVLEKDGLNFYAGSKKWNLEPMTLKFKHSRKIPFLSKFQIFNNSDCEFSITYSHLGRLFYAMIDPTYDQLDQEADFFLEFISENGLCQTWQDHVKKEWGTESASNKKLNADSVYSHALVGHYTLRGIQ